MSIPKEDQDYLTEWCQVFKKDKFNKWMKREALKKLVVAGKADDWWVVAIDFDTGDSSLICPYCATGVEHRGTLH